MGAWVQREAEGDRSDEESGDRAHAGPTANPGLRIPARELEDAVAVKLAALFADPVALTQMAGLALDPAQLPALASACQHHADQLRSSLSRQHATLIAQVRVLPATLEMDIDAAGLAALLKLTDR